MDSPQSRAQFVAPNLESSPPIFGWSDADPGADAGRGRQSRGEPGACEAIHQTGCAESPQRTLRIPATRERVRVEGLHNPFLVIWVDRESGTAQLVPLVD